MSEDIQQIAEGLTPARKTMVLALPADGSWGAVPSRRVARRAWLIAPCIIHHMHHPKDQAQWRLSATGQQVRAYLQGTPS